MYTLFIILYHHNDSTYLFNHLSCRNIPTIQNVNNILINFTFHMICSHFREYFLKIFSNPKCVGIIHVTEFPISCSNAIHTDNISKFKWMATAQKMNLLEPFIHYQIPTLQQKQHHMYRLTNGFYSHSNSNRSPKSQKCLINVISFN